MTMGSPSTTKSRTQSVPVRSAAPRPSRLTSRLTHAARCVGIESDELEQQSRVHGFGPQAARLTGLLPHIGGERLATLEHAAHVERRHLVRRFCRDIVTLRSVVSE